MKKIKKYIDKLFFIKEDKIWAEELEEVFL